MQNHSQKYCIIEILNIVKGMGQFELFCNKQQKNVVSVVSSVVYYARVKLMPNN